MQKNLFFILLLMMPNVAWCESNTALENIHPEKLMRTFGGWSICFKLFQFIRQTLPSGSTLLELGSGWSSQEFSKHYTVYSVEHNARWVGSYNTNYIHAPIEGRWYNVQTLKGNLPASYDMILIDGPPGYPGAGTGRYGFFLNKELFNLDVPILIDDVDRPVELKLLQDLSAYLERPYEITYCGNKAFGYIPGANK